MRPGDEICRGVDPDGELLGVRDSHDPFRGLGVPEDLWVAEVGRVDVQDRVAGVAMEGVAFVEGVGERLGLNGSGGGEDGDNAICLIGEKAGSVVRVNDDGAGEDAFAAVERKDGDGLICPMV